MATRSIVLEREIEELDKEIKKLQISGNSKGSYDNKSAILK